MQRNFLVVEKETGTSQVLTEIYAYQYVGLIAGHDTLEDLAYRFSKYGKLLFAAIPFRD